MSNPMTPLYVPDDHICTCPRCSAAVRQYWYRVAGRYETFRAGRMPPFWFDEPTLGDLLCPGVEACYDGAYGGEPWSLHISLNQRDLTSHALTLHPHRCRSCGGGYPCRTLLRGEATKLTMRYTDLYNPDLHQRIMSLYANPEALVFLYEPPYVSDDNENELYWILS